MSAPFPPSVMRAWQYSNTKGGLEKNLKLNTSAPLPKPSSSQSLIQIIAAALNPIDYKPAENGLINRLAIRKPATPGLDFVGRVVSTPSQSPFKTGELVFGVVGSSPLAGGALAEYGFAGNEQLAVLPEGVDPTEAATIGVAGLTAYQSIVPHVKKGDKVFINGGSGGTGVYGIQIAKAVGCYVTTTCSTPNVELCKRIGADVVIDYKKQNVVEALKASGDQFDHIVDNVGLETAIYFNCHEYSKPSTMYVTVGGGPSFDFISNSLKRKYIPGFLGGGKRKVQGFWPTPSSTDLLQIGNWIQEGKITPVIDEKFSFDRAPDAIAKLKTGRAKGKIVVDVASETYKNAWFE